MPGILPGMCVEGPCMVDGNGVHPLPVDPLPTAITALINQQGYVHRLVIEAFSENSRNKLLQAMLVDPTIANYNNAVAVINEIFELQKDVIAPLAWK